MALLLRLVQNAQRAKDRAGMFRVMGVAAALGSMYGKTWAIVIGVCRYRHPVPLMSYGGRHVLFSWRLAW